MIDYLLLTQEDLIMLIIIVFIQIFVFFFFFFLERFIPARKINRADSFTLAWVAINAFAVTWANVSMHYYASIDGILKHNLNAVVSGLMFYFCYSFIAYWYHRIRHSNKYLWQFIHKFHH